MTNRFPVIVLAAAVVLSACAKEETRTALAETAAQPAVQPAAETPAEAAAPAQVASSSDPNTVKVYKDPNCGCCSKWVDHMRANGFTVETMDLPDLTMVKERYAIGQSLRSCHTAVIGDYAFEGHVPADVIKKFLEEKPSVAGLAVPGMPSGSPGMEGATKDKYDVLTFDRAGRTTVYAQR
ncbi:MAG TPA: DUF411 domain-containing protein [Gemmatimonadaceae bacterium]|nr:DUF411 domain-containing protein [Gemmatimonadaceae bacterium]